MLKCRLWTAITHLEARWLDVFAPLRAQRVADLTERRLSPRRRQHGFDHVAIGPGNLDHLRQCCVDGRIVSSTPPDAESLTLLNFDLVADPQDLQWPGHAGGVNVDTDDLLIALLQLSLITECGVGDLSGEPALLDAEQ
jgi:hypothetical protein